MAAATVLKGGDVVHFKGGVVYVGEIYVNWSGDSDAPITYDANTDSNWGRERATIDLAHKFYHAFTAPSGASYISIKGFRITRAKNARSATSQTITRNGQDIVGVNYGGNGLVSSLGAIYVAGGTGWLVADCTFFEFENWGDRSVEGAETDGDPKTSPSVPLDQVGVYLRNTHRSALSNLVFWAVGRDCVRLTSATDVRIDSCDFGGEADAGTNSGWFSVAVRLSSGARNITIKDSRFHDGWQYQGDDTLQRSHAGDWIHAYGNNDGVFRAADDVSDVVVERCFFWCDKEWNRAHGTAYSFLEDDVFNWTWRNNLFINSFSGAVEIERTSNVVFYANTFVDFPHGSGGGSPLHFFVGSNGSYPRQTELRNNIFMTLNSNSAVQPLGSSSSGILEYPSSDHNLFYSPKNGGKAVRWNGKNHSLVEWRALSGQDVNSVYGDPLFSAMPLTGASVVPSTRWRLLPDSPGIGAGTILSGFRDDYEGNLRPMAAGWDVGAFQVAAPPPFSPSGLRVVSK